MADYILSGCSAADLTKEHFERIGVPYICFHFMMDGVLYPDDLGQTMPADEMYARMAAGASTSTSQVNISEYVDYFSAFCEQGKDIVHVTLSSGISGTYGSAANAALIVRERYPEREIYVVDSLGASSGYGLILDTAAGLRDQGMSAKELASWIEANRLRLNHWFFSTDLSSYVRGGRISRTAAFFGGVFEICPLLNMDSQGRLIPRRKIRTKQNVIREIVQRMVDNADNGTDYSGKCYISMSACRDDAEAVARLVEEKFPKLDGRVEINNVGGLIGAHTGPGTVALFFWGKERVD
ncbi:MAG: DegV family protein [Oscillospiraceae bacterium]|nr:DegV family protein [Oscillospiraceae bacterium]